MAVKSLKHMLLCKIMTNASDEVPGLIDSKASKVGSSSELESMRAIAEVIACEDPQCVLPMCLSVGVNDRGNAALADMRKDRCYSERDWRLLMLSS